MNIQDIDLPTAASAPPFVRRLPIDIRPDPSMVVLRAFMPGPTGVGPTGTTRAQRIISRVLDLSDRQTKQAMRRVLAGFADRHRDVQSFFLRRFNEVARPQLTERLLTLDQQLLIGAYFSHEYSFQAAALFNPSIVPHPSQDGVADGGLRIVMSLRAVGEGHISSICFRTGTIDAHGNLTLDEPRAHSAIAGLEEAEGASEDGTVAVNCGLNHELDESVIFPMTAAQASGLEDLRLVRFTEEDGSSCYFGTYTAYSGSAIASEMLTTRDFLRFEMTPMRGNASRNKGMALFPRRIGGRYAMIGRQDNENLWLLYSDDPYEWEEGELLLTPKFNWEFTQIGNCGSPIEIDEGWLVLMHGVGAVRNYSIGAFLLDKEDPSRIIARMPEPLIRPSGDEREGYVPNVVYTCGALVHGRTLVLPYAVADSNTTAATMDVGDLLDAMG